MRLRAAGAREMEGIRRIILLCLSPYHPRGITLCAQRARKDTLITFPLLINMVLPGGYLTLLHVFSYFLTLLMLTQTSAPISAVNTTAILLPTCFNAKSPCYCAYRFAARLHRELTRLAKSFGDGCIYEPNVSGGRHHTGFKVGSWMSRPDVDVTHRIKSSFGILMSGKHDDEGVMFTSETFRTTDRE